MHFPTQYLNNLKVDRKQILLPENWASENLSDLPEFDRARPRMKIQVSGNLVWFPGFQVSGNLVPPWQGGAHRDCSVSSYLRLGKYLCVYSSDDSGSGSLVSRGPQLLASYLTWVLVTSYLTTLTLWSGLLLELWYVHHGPSVSISSLAKSEKMVRKFWIPGFWAWPPHSQSQAMPTFLKRSHWSTKTLINIYWAHKMLGIILRTLTIPIRGWRLQAV